MLSTLAARTTPKIRARIKRALIVCWVAAAALLLIGAFALALFGERVEAHLLNGDAWTQVAVAGMLSLMAAYVDASIGMGYGTTITPLLLLIGFSPKQIVPAVLIQQLVAGTVAAWSHHLVGNADLRPGRPAFRLALLLGLCGLLGGVGAAGVALHLADRTIELATAAIVISMGLLVAIRGRLKLRFSFWRAAGVGLVAAANKGLMGGGYGPLITAGQVATGLPAHEAVAVTCLAESLTCAGGLLTYALGGIGIYWPLVGSIAISGALAALPAAVTVRVFSPSKLSTAIAVGCLALGILTMLQVLV